MKQPKICIIHDWLTNMGGAENVVLSLHKAFPDAPIYTSTFAAEQMPKFKNIDVRTTYLQKLPKFLQKLHKLLPVMRVHAFSKLDLSEFDIIISSSSAESKQVKKSRDDQIHICYCHTPIRYYWSHYDNYKKDPSFGKLNFLVKMMMPILVPPLKKADYKAAQNVDFFIANSQEVQKRIKKYYNKKSIVIHPPVSVDRFKPAQKRGDFYVALGRQVPYKRIDLAVKACSELNIPLKVFGNGPKHQELINLANDKIQFFSDRFGDASDKNVEAALNHARGFIFPTEEDFGIVQVEALSAGAPVIAYKKGGALDIVDDNKTGIFFDKQTTKSLKKAIEKAEKTNFDIKLLTKKAAQFDEKIFIQKIKKVVDDLYN